MSDSTLEYMTRWDGSPGPSIGVMAVAVLVLWWSLRLLRWKRRGRWQRALLVSFPATVSLLVLADFITCLVWTYRFILSHPDLW